MRQPPRQPPRQPARNTARRAAPKAAPPRGGKAAARGAPRQQARNQQTKVNARAAQHARDAQRAQQRSGARSGPARGRGVGRSQPKQRGWRSWWATHEMDRRQRMGRTGAGGRQVGILASRGWTAGRASWAFFLLLLSAFTGSAALGAGSGGIAALSFLFLLGAIAVATSARAKAFFAAYPVRTTSVADFNIDDLKVDEEPAAGLDDSELNSLADLERSMQRAQTREQPTTQAAATMTPSPRQSTEDAPPPTTVAALESGAVEKPADDADDITEATPSRELSVGVGDTVVAPADTVQQEALEAPGVEAAATGPVEVEASDRVPVDAAEATEPKKTVDAPTDDVPTTHAAASSPSPVVADVVDDPVGDDEPVERSNDVVTEAPLNLLAAESAGSDLLSAYAEETSLAPEAVRDVAATLIVSDLAASVMFYTELLGLVEIDRARDAVLLEAGFGRVLLWRRDDAPGSGDPVMHLTFEVGDIDSAYRTLSARGVTFTHPPRSALSGEVHDLRAASFLDPDGHGLAITELKQRAETIVDGDGK